MPDARQPIQRASDTPEFARIIEADLANANAEIAIMTCTFDALRRENANLKHQLFAKDQELAILRKMRADMLVKGIASGLQPVSDSPSTAKEATA